MGYLANNLFRLVLIVVFWGEISCFSVDSVLAQSIKDTPAAEEYTQKKDKFTKRFRPKDNDELVPSEDNAENMPSFASGRPIATLPRTENLKQIYLREGEPYPVSQPKKRAHIGSIYENAVLEDGRHVIIRTDRSLHTTARIELEGKRSELLPNGHYELHESKLTRLPDNSYNLTDDISYLLSIYDGEVINYVPNWAVKEGDFTAFRLQY